jgi:hypothetical protein
LYTEDGPVGGHRTAISCSSALSDPGLVQSFVHTEPIPLHSRGVRPPHRTAVPHRHLSATGTAPILQPRRTHTKNRVILVIH